MLQGSSARSNHKFVTEMRVNNRGYGKGKDGILAATYIRAIKPRERRQWASLGDSCSWVLGVRTRTDQRPGQGFE
jgi:hypothetical protein